MTVRTLSCLIAAFAFAGVLAAAPAQADTSTAAKTAQKSNSHSPRLIKNPNQETAAERERRLKRECKGMPNAGACLGYGS